MPKLQISKKEYETRRNRIIKEMGDEFDAVCLFNPTHIFYLTNFGFLQTERPIALILTKNNETFSLIPSLEQDRIEEVGYVEETRVYPEYPGKKHPMKYLKDLVTELGLEDKVIGVDSTAPPSVMGYSGPTLEEILPNSVIKDKMGDVIKEMMMVKSEEEIQLINESARWGGVAHEKLQQFTKPGANETHISNEATMEASKEMIETLGTAYRAVRKSRAGAFAGFRGQVGKHSAFPHSVSLNATIQNGDVLVTGASANVGGYTSELERTLLVGESPKKHRKYFNLMKEVQEVAFEAIEPGVKCSKVDKVVKKFYKKEDLLDLWRHHTGHALGLNGHEPPFFDVGDETRLKVGMVMSVEPGIYIPGFAGFRHSDTIVVVEGGIERITMYPRDLRNLTIPT
ncbi:MAG: aminopeptidase P family protein [Candidatus Korarchaeota archaeon]|nr:aminopeptidase P family protein [Candidatus Korarchaeota archaeon]NIU83901.1 M24 family metallopeptidase [Candidatus Thorarchaeota archaeon]NIW14044.1 M24 family metallopeptidase [Candidatus Thorarchaeota archaeon]NIW51733.1 M24 family metallopeptidase [Candidatus Korarchaeota archaeon]